MVALAHDAGLTSSSLSCRSGGSVCLSACCPIFLYCARWGFGPGPAGQLRLYSFCSCCWAAAYRLAAGSPCWATTSWPSRVLGLAGLFYKNPYGFFIRRSWWAVVARFLVALASPARPWSGAEYYAGQLLRHDHDQPRGSTPRSYNGSDMVRGSCCVCVVVGWAAVEAPGQVLPRRGSAEIKPPVCEFNVQEKSGGADPAGFFLFARFQRW